MEGSLSPTRLVIPRNARNLLLWGHLIGVMLGFCTIVIHFHIFHSP